MELREYQKRTITNLYKWFGEGNAGNPCIVLPTGSGKSYIIAELCRDIIQSWPDQKILILTHVKELIEQDLEKILIAWPDAPIGIYSAGLHTKHLGEPITIAGIQSIRKKSADIGHIDIIIVDESHLISHKQEGGYRSLISELQEINPNARVVGLTATPYRLGHGLLTDKPAIFDAILEPTSIEELIAKKYLAPLRSKMTDFQYDTEGVAKRGGEFVEHDLQSVINISSQNEEVVDEILKWGKDRKAWLVFCSGVDHSIAMRDVLLSRGISTACVLGKTPKDERKDILERFKAGELRAVTNANILTTGFNYPDIDLIAMCRPTMSPGLYCQMAGRGMRIKDHVEDCLLLDFAGNISTHGVITAVRPPVKKGQGNGPAPIKLCDRCHELVPIACRVCPACGHEFPPPKVAPLYLRDDDIMGDKNKEMVVTSWSWRVQKSYTSGKLMLTVTYNGRGIGESVVEYLCVLHSGYAEEKARRKLVSIVDKAIISLPQYEAKEMASSFTDSYHRMNGDIENLENMAGVLNRLRNPFLIKYTKDGKFSNTYSWEWK